MKKIGITLGDQAGVGPEVVDAALADPRLLEWFPEDSVKYSIIGDRIDAVAGMPDADSARAALNDLESSITGTDRVRDRELSHRLSGHEHAVADLGFPHEVSQWIV